jgi:hypothetical protein
MHLQESTPGSTPDPPLKFAVAVDNSALSSYIVNSYS